MLLDSFKAFGGLTTFEEYDAQTVSCGDKASCAAKSYENTHELSSHKATFCTARFSTDFHHNHTPSPLVCLGWRSFVCAGYVLVLK